MALHETTDIPARNQQPEPPRRYDRHGSYLARGRSFSAVTLGRRPVEISPQSLEGGTLNLHRSAFPRQGLSGLRHGHFLAGPNHNSLTGANRSRVVETLFPRTPISLDLRASPAKVLSKGSGSHINEPTLPHMARSSGEGPTPWVSRMTKRVDGVRRRG